MSKITVNSKDVTRQTADALVVLVGQGSKGRLTVLGQAAAGLEALVQQIAGPLGVSGEAESLVKVPAGAAAQAPLLVLAGVGSAASVDAEKVRRAAGGATLALSGKKKVIVAAPDQDDLAVAAAEGALLGAYGYTAYKKASAIKDPVQEIVLATNAKGKAVRAGVSRAQVVAQAVHGTRDLVNMPPLDLFPAAFAQEAVKLAKAAGVSTRVLDDKQLRAGGFGGLIGVGQGSSRPPRLVRLEWNGGSGRRTGGPDLALVGKGITFDTGGISIKPAAGMEHMKSDMAGAAAVLHTILAAAALKLPVHITGWLCLAENMPSGTAQRPSDVITIHGGRTVEVLNTDAEGRLVMADGIVAASKERSAMIVDVATLTGAQVVALGNRVSAVMSNDDALRDRIVSVSQQAGEQFWPMPLPEELRAAMDSPVADIANIGDRAGGMLSAGLFLKEFVGRVDGTEDETSPQIPWAHLDIAGPALNTSGAFGYTPKGGTGVAVRTLVALAEQLGSTARA